MLFQQQKLGEIVEILFISDSEYRTEPLQTDV